MAGEAREKCGVVGITMLESEAVASELMRDCLFALQHRGTEASGIASLSDDGTLRVHHGKGMVHDVYDSKAIHELAGSIAIGHNRYATSGLKDDGHPQPYTDLAVGFGLAQNGNLPDTGLLEMHLAKNRIKTAPMNDSEMMGLAVAQYIREGKDVVDAIDKAYPLFSGAFSCVGVHDDLIIGFRDPKGIRPLAIGQMEDDGYVLSSETCGLDMANASYIREVEPGELVAVTADGIESKKLAESENKLDIFEFVYFTRHDSYLYGQSVYEVRRRFGEQLAELHPPIMEDTSDVVVVPIPDTSIPAAEGYSERLGLTQRQLVIKNRYIGRTFMLPTDQARKQQLNRKHNMIFQSMRGKDIIFIDDSIVRMNTIPNIVKRAQAAGAKSVSVLIASPPVRFPDYYGIDTPDQKELAAANLTIDEMRKTIGCKYLGFLTLGKMVDATEVPYEMFNLSCFNGEYPIDIGKRKKEIKPPVSMELAE